ncbi:hypothetical protein [Nocardiopsis lucentensis]|uniref:hypothetical protein n=1 Tax=Nocardiopsis lucentensis TaxID=53441 RepID=UPI0004772D40|nr:hypothetical protein [Nocardiopsis lucentensis]
MTHPIPAHRPPSDQLCRPVPRPQPLLGPFCPSCVHRSCRERRAERLPRIGGHRAEFAREHLRAASVQARYPHLVVWFGESTQSYWVAGSGGLTEAPNLGALLLLVGPVQVGT